MSALEVLLLIPLLFVLVGAMMAYAYFSGRMRTQEAEERQKREQQPLLKDSEP